MSSLHSSNPQRRSASSSQTKAKTRTKTRKTRRKGTRSSPEPRSVLVKLPSDDQAFQIIDGFGGVVAFGMNGQFAARTGGEHHQAHDAFAVHFLTVLFHRNLALVAIGSFDKQRRRPGVNAQFVDDRQLASDA